MIETSSMIPDSNSVSCRRGCCVVGIGLVVTGSRYADGREPEDGYQDMSWPTVGAHNESDPRSEAVHSSRPIRVGYSLVQM